MTHPAAIAALVVLVVNDHLLKAAYPGWITGKLSDFAGMVLAPLVLVAIVDAIAPVRAWMGWASAVAVGCAFALCKTWAPATEAYEAAAIDGARRAGTRRQRSDRAADGRGGGEGG